MDRKLNSRSEKVRSKVLHAAAKLFLDRGYTNSTMKEISSLAGVNYGSMMFVFRSKEDILSELVGIVLDSQFEATTRLLEDKTEDKILFYAAETTLQLYMAESSEHIRELYTLSYSQSASSNIIYEKVTMKLAEIFKEQYPDYTQGEFYEKELWLGQEFARLEDPSIRIRLHLSYLGNAREELVELPNLKAAELQQVGITMDKEFNIYLKLRNTSETPTCSGAVAL